MIVWATYPRRRQTVPTVRDYCISVRFALRILISRRKKSDRDATKRCDHDRHFEREIYFATSESFSHWPEACFTRNYTFSTAKTGDGRSPAARRTARLDASISCGPSPFFFFVATRFYFIIDVADDPSLSPTPEERDDRAENNAAWQLWSLPFCRCQIS